jgi:transposase-like protein
MKKLRLVGNKGKRRRARAISVTEAKGPVWEGYDGEPIDSQHLLISMLLPPAVKEFLRQLEDEVTELCGARNRTGAENHRWGGQAGSVVIGNQRVRVKKPRVRSKAKGQEVMLPVYERFQDPNIFDETVFREGLKKVSQRDFSEGLPKIASSFGFTKSSVSRRWIRSTQKKLEELNSRDLRSLGIVAVFIDGKRFAKHGVVIALGVTEGGRKYVLGIYQSDTENSSACLNLLNDLEERGLPSENLLFVVDGGSGLNKALEIKYAVHDPEKRRAVRIRCSIHKWRNLEKVLADEHHSEAAALFWAIRDAKNLSEAQSVSRSLEDFLGRVNRSALKTYLEAKDDLLVIHQLKLNNHLKRFFSTTNPLESVNYLTEEDLRRVKRWRNSNHFQRWLATACLAAEKRMRRVMGYHGLPAMKIALRNLCCVGSDLDNQEAISA